MWTLAATLAAGLTVSCSPRSEDPAHAPAARHSPVPGPGPAAARAQLPGSGVPRRATADPITVSIQAEVFVRPPKGAGETALWVPVPSPDESQQVDLATLVVSVDGRPLSRQVPVADEHGNWYLHVRRATDAPFSLSYRVRVARAAPGYSGDRTLAGLLETVAGGDAPEMLQYPYAGRIEEAVASVTRQEAERDLAGAVLDRILAAVDGVGSPVLRAAVLNEILRRNGHYLKSGAYGRGNSTWFCLTGQGNCTDFHFTYLDVAQRVNLPGVLRVGLPLSEEPEQAVAGSGGIPGYHCWVYLYEPVGFAIDPAWEARLQRPTGAYFGQPLNDRIKLTQGAELRLAPPIEGSALPYVFEAYAEADGAPLAREYGVPNPGRPAASGVWTQYRFQRLGNAARATVSPGLQRRVDLSGPSL